MSPSQLLQRLGLLGLSLLLPALLLGLAATWMFALDKLGHHDRVLAWVQGTPAQLQSLQARVTRHPVFADGEFVPDGFPDHRPEECAGLDVAVGFSRLRTFELSAARTTLQDLVRASGVRSCEAHATVYNDLPSPFDPEAWDDSLVTALLMLVVPTGTLLIAYWGFGVGFRLPSPFALPRPVWPALGIAVAAAVAGVAAVHLIDGLSRLVWPGSGMGSDAILGMDADAPWWPMFLIVGLYAPFLEELAFRAWLIPVAERAVGLLPACGLSVLAFTAVHLPFVGPELPGTVVLAAIFSAVYALTRSLPACLVAHGGYNVLALALHAAFSG
ncbi:CPBP family intramembrane glutamic endopeptidase [Arenimonas donghaensis]|uniref:CAAX prenyl protease 2/Lysostaphin resistance protein A-like domain-containing protein n=1 Tax=Arenimonas donghaensis DSM 18148 = HO3-R19 TaxID=1121014 RepID=A0A087MM77_9GAMM|nr:type II CAAX endopeptidase family protein [Arenimonas donghaensis]KFL37980.1 hypothetical protein N788_02055 [Arenimonas donghaensis DSM 18148 = HO3-R19]